MFSALCGWSLFPSDPDLVKIEVLVVEPPPVKPDANESLRPLGQRFHLHGLRDASRSKSANALLTGDPSSRSTLSISGLGYGRRLKPCLLNGFEGNANPVVLNKDAPLGRLKRLLKDNADLIGISIIGILDQLDQSDHFVTDKVPPNSANYTGPRPESRRTLTC